ncbi:Pentatricopeptide repeat [Arabidopsis thaliana x Arabidopsis arenosa]|uniref:Pentatricopeptide repeat n=1 Tax=Arabidopsis thaliana x Arabidopsis arenosa TaxID=1240361 RepID=A0A8T1YBL1_9BRAS|nr:Pentatricopeptide repeat [Arabidopsis thaliana x Arabidopsis arenosa]
MIRVSTCVNRRLCYQYSSFAGYGGSENPRLSKNPAAANIPIPHRSNPEPKGQDLDFVNVAHSHLIQSDWDKLNKLSDHLDSFRVKNVLLKIQKDYLLSLEFFNWTKTRNPGSHSLETHAIVLHTLTKNRKFKSAESILRDVLVNGGVDLPAKVFDALLYSYRECDSTPRVFDSLFKTFAHLKKFRNATDTFMQMKDYGFLPTVESCNAYMSSLLGQGRVDIALRSGKLVKGIELLQDMERLGFRATDVSYNTLIAGHCEKGLLSSALKLKNMMGKNGLQPNVVTFNTLIHGFCRAVKLQEASKVFGEMKALNVAPNTVTYNTLINGYSQQGDHEMAFRFYEDMVCNGIQRDILTYNALILGLCKQAKTRKAAQFVKELDKENLVPNSSTFSALIMGQCVRRNADRGFELYKSMIRSGCHPNEQTLNILISAFCKNEDFDGAAQVLREIVRRSIPLDSRTVHQVCNGLKHQGKDQLVKELLQEMEGKKFLQEPLDN